MNDRWQKRAAVFNMIKYYALLRSSCIKYQWFHSIPVNALARRYRTQVEQKMLRVKLMDYKRILYHIVVRPVLHCWCDVVPYFIQSCWWLSNTNFPPVQESYRHYSTSFLCIQVNRAWVRLNFPGWNVMYDLRCAGNKARVLNIILRRRNNYRL